MTTEQIIRIYVHNDRTDRDLYQRVKMVETEAETHTICQNFRPRHQWTDRDFELFAQKVRKMLIPLSCVTEY